jgi:hypothetical protein
MAVFAFDQFFTFGVPSLPSFSMATVSFMNEVIEKSPIDQFLSIVTSRDGVHGEVRTKG